MTDTDSVLISGDEESAGLDLRGHHVEVRSLRSPDKTTPNEDTALVAPVGTNGLVVAVADGVGGSPAGREAAQLVMQTLATALAAREEDSGSLRTTILDAIEAANHALLDSGRRGATTLVVAEIVDRVLRCYHIGDSEMYVVGQRGALKARIVPHSPTGFAVEAGLLRENEAVQHDQRHVLFNVVGANDMRVEISAPVKLARYDTVLLASDGLVDNLYPDEIIATIKAGGLAGAVEKLVQQARRRMANDASSKPSKPDDLTVVVCRQSRG